MHNDMFWMKNWRHNFFVIYYYVAMTQQHDDCPHEYHQAHIILHKGFLYQFTSMNEIVS